MAPTSGIRSKNPNRIASGSREGNVEDSQRHVGHQPGQDADHEVAEHVAGDRVRDVVGDRPQPPGPLRRHLSVEELEQAASVLDQEEGDHQDREQLHEAGEDADGDVPQGAGGVAELGRQLLRLLGQLLGDLVAVVVVAEGLVVAQVVDVSGQIGGQVLDAVDQRRHDQQPDPEDPGGDAEVDEQDRQPARHAALVEPVDRRGDRDREEGGDQDEADDVADQVGEVERPDHRGGDQDDLRHRLAETSAWSIAGQRRREPGRSSPGLATKAQGHIGGCNR